MKTIFLVWFDNDKEYVEDHERYILKAFNTRLKAERFIKNHCNEQFTPSKSIEEFEKCCSGSLQALKNSAFYAESIQKMYNTFSEKESGEFAYTRDPDKLYIEEMNVH